MSKWERKELIFDLAGSIKFQWNKRLVVASVCLKFILLRSLKINLKRGTK